ncbi:hypothetical protein ACSQ8B_21900 [Marinovum sp. F03]
MTTEIGLAIDQRAGGEIEAHAHHQPVEIDPPPGHGDGKDIQHLRAGQRREAEGVHILRRGQAEIDLGAAFAGVEPFEPKRGGRAMRPEPGDRLMRRSGVGQQVRQPGAGDVPVCPRGLDIKCQPRPFGGKAEPERTVAKGVLRGAVLRQDPRQQRFGRRSKALGAGRPHRGAHRLARGIDPRGARKLRAGIAEIAQRLATGSGRQAELQGGSVRIQRRAPEGVFGVKPLRAEHCRQAFIRAGALRGRGQPPRRLAQSEGAPPDPGQRRRHCGWHQLGGGPALTVMTLGVPPLSPSAP